MSSSRKLENFHTNSSVNLQSIIWFLNNNKKQHSQIDKTSSKVFLFSH